MGFELYKGQIIYFQHSTPKSCIKLHGITVRSKLQGVQCNPLNPLFFTPPLAWCNNSKCSSQTFKFDRKNGNQTHRPNRKNRKKPPLKLPPKMCNKTLLSLS